MAIDTPSRRRVLLVGDERAIRDLVRAPLHRAGFDIVETGDGREALERARSEPFDIVVLDVMLPHVDGITLCRAIRANGANRDAPILMMTVRTTEADTVLGLESGADDYLTKPFGAREFLARVSAILRRSLPAEDASDSKAAAIVGTRELTLDVSGRRAVVRGAPVDLTRQEFDLLCLLASRPGIVFSRAALLARLWPGDAHVTERTVDTVVSRIRHKVEVDPQNPALILTAWGVGYKFVDAE